MAGEDLEVEHEMTSEEDAAADAAFEASFNAARGDKHHAEGTLENDANGQPLITGGQVDHEQEGKDEAAAAAAAEADAQAKAQAAAEAEANAPVAITKAELDALRAGVARVTELEGELRRTNDTTAGRIGSLKQTLDAVKAQAQQGIKPSFKQMTRISTEFPELAALMREDLEEAFGPGNATQEAPPAQTQDDGAASGDQPGAQPTVDPFADQRVQARLKALEMTVVDAAHPGWRDLAKTPEFNEWRSSLNPEAQQLLGSSWDSNVLKDAFTHFKDWNGKRAAAANASKERGKRLENGVPATTGAPTGANAPDEDAAFLSGFNKARGQGGR